MNGKSIALDTSLDVLGSRISMGNSIVEAIEHRVEAGWRCFHIWKHILTSSASLDNKLDFFKRTVLRSLVWELATCKSNIGGIQKMATAMHLMVRKMMRLKRKPILDGDSNTVAMEPWLDWQIRSLNRARQELETRSLSAQCCFVNE